MEFCSFWGLTLTVKWRNVDKAAGDSKTAEEKANGEFPWANKTLHISLKDKVLS